jgi:predicted PurR-regulated permease PerM
MENLLKAKAEKFSYLFMLIFFIMAVFMHLATAILVMLFIYFALRKLNFLKPDKKWIALFLFIFLIAGISYGLGYFVHEARNMPQIIDKSIPSIIEWASKYEVELPFDDYESLKLVLRETAESQKVFLGNMLSGATMHVALLVICMIASITFFINPKVELDRKPGSEPKNLYALYYDSVVQRFSTFYKSFDNVMGAQIIISSINTFFTTIFIFSLGMPYPVVIIGVTFLCGLLPVVGNLISNTIIICIGFTVSPKLAFLALIFLVLIHKLEYFLNSKVIGSRIRNPVWLMLIGLVLGERLMGIAGMVLAPVILYYIKVELSRFKISKQDAE